MLVSEKREHAVLVHDDSILGLLVEQYELIFQMYHLPSQRAIGDPWIRPESS